MARPAGANVAERIFTLDDLTGARSVCGCLACNLGAVFADHLTAQRTGYPGPVTTLGRRGPAPGTTAVPHFLAVRLGGGLVDVVVWEEMRPYQLAAGLPDHKARARGPVLAGRIPRLVRIRQAIRASRFTPWATPTTPTARTRIDRIYANQQLLPAIREVEVVDMKGLSDHHTVVVRLDRDTLTEILNHTLARAA
jgi:hypothetical protein